MDAVVGEQDLEKRDAAAVVRPAVADARSRGVAESAPGICAAASAGGAGHVVLRGGGEDLQLFDQRHDSRIVLFLRGGAIAEDEFGSAKRIPEPFLQGPKPV